MTQSFARFDGGVVVEVGSIPDGAKISDFFHPILLANIRLCDPTVATGWTYDGKKFAAPVISAPSAAKLTAYAANKRFEIETAGITVNGASIATDRASQALITGAYNYVQANPSALVKFKTATGFVELSAAQMTAIANAVGAHVQAAFAAEEAVDTAITAGTIKSFSDIDASAWPTNS